MAAFRFRKRFGQHILSSEDILNRIVAAAQLRPTERLLEIGPGTGNLTHKLLQPGNQLTAVEVDVRMVEHLRKRFASHPRLDLRHEDVLLGELPPFDVCVANVPYQVRANPVPRDAKRRDARRLDFFAPALSAAGRIGSLRPSSAHVSGGVCGETLCQVRARGACRRARIPPSEPSCRLGTSA